MRCPLCRASLSDRDQRCPRCDALLDHLPFTSLNLDDSPGDLPDPVSPTGSTKVELGGDTRIVGELGGDFSSWSGSGDALLGLSADEYLEAPTGVVERLVLTPQVYVDEGLVKLLKLEAVFALSPGDDDALSVFERHIASFLDGDRPLARVARKANVSIDDARIALALLHEKRRVRLVGHMIVPERFETKTGARKAPSRPSPDGEPTKPVRPAMRRPAPAATTRSDERTRPMTPPAKPAPHRPFDPTKRSPPPGFQRYGEQQDVRLLKLAMQKEADGLYDEAVRLLRKAIEVNPHAAVLYNRLGVVLATRQKDYTAAAEVLFQACELEPNNDTYMANLAKVAERAEVARAEEERAKQQVFGGLFRRRK